MNIVSLSVILRAKVVLVLVLVLVMVWQPGFEVVYIDFDGVGCWSRVWRLDSLSLVISFKAEPLSW